MPSQSEPSTLNYLTPSPWRALTPSLRNTHPRPLAYLTPTLGEPSPLNYLIPSPFRTLNPKLSNQPLANPQPYPLITPNPYP